MPTTVLSHPDGSKTVIETNANGDHRVFIIKADGSTVEAQGSSFGISHEELANSMKLPDDTASTFPVDKFEEIGNGLGLGSVDPAAGVGAATAAGAGESEGPGAAAGTGAGEGEDPSAGVGAGTATSEGAGQGAPTGGGGGGPLEDLSQHEQQ